VVGDYKTSGKLGDRCSVTKMLKGRRLQVPLYHLLGGDSTRVELLGVGPAYVDADESRAAFDGFANDAERQAFLETLGVLATLWARGVFPLHADSHCDWCAYRQACRRNHPPTREREELARDAQAYGLLRKKSRSGRATLADVRASEAGRR
jgi:ATP-dependent helicase/nuclease subunit B